MGIQLITSVDNSSLFLMCGDDYVLSLFLSLLCLPTFPVFPAGAPVMSVEAAGIQGWERWAHAPFGMARFGASAPVKHVYAKFGYTVENLTKQAS